MLLNRWKFIVLALFMAWFGRDGARAQESQPVSTPQPNCRLAVNLPATAGSIAGPLDNRQVGCLNFTFTAAVPTTISALNLVVETAQSNGVANCVGCAWSTFTAATGSNPTTSAAGSNATFTTAAGSTYFDYLRVRLVSVTGTGTIQGKLYSSITTSSGGGGGGSGCVGTAGTPCIVAGPDAVGDAPTKNPVQVAGYDFNGNVLNLLLNNNNGALEVETGPIQTQSTNPKTFLPVLNFNCNSTAPITISGAGTITLVPVSGGSHIVHICSIALSLSGPATIQFIEGTQSVTPCDTAAANMSGAFSTVQSYTQTWGFSYGPQTATAGDDACMTVTGAVTGGGWVTYVNNLAI